MGMADSEAYNAKHGDVVLRFRIAGQTSINLRCEPMPGVEADVKLRFFDNMRQVRMVSVKSPWFVKVDKVVGTFHIENSVGGWAYVTTVGLHGPRELDRMLFERVRHLSNIAQGDVVRVRISLRMEARFTPEALSLLQELGGPDESGAVGSSDGDAVSDAVSDVASDAVSDVASDVASSQTEPIATDLSALLKELHLCSPQLSKDLIPDVLVQLRQIEEAVLRRRTEVTDLDDLTCGICMERPREWALACGHALCGICKERVQNKCPSCRAQNTTPALRLYL
jgi:hypothetical protein